MQQVEIDEMHTYVGSKKTKNGSGMLLISWEEGGYNVLLATATGFSLWKIREKCQNATVFTDCWQAYEDFIPRENHIQGKTGIYTVEGLNSVVRRLLAWQECGGKQNVTANQKQCSTYL